MRKVSYVLLAALTLPIITRATSVDRSWVSNTVKSIGRPVSNFLSQWGFTEVAKRSVESFGGQVLEDTSLSTLYYGLGLDKADNSLSITTEAQALMNKSLQKGLGGRFLGFKEAQPLPSLAALVLPLSIGKGVQAGLSFVPGVALIAHDVGKAAAQAAGVIVRFVFKRELSYKESNCDSLTLTAIQSLSEDVAAGFAKTYKASLSKLSKTQVESFVMYASISILDHVDHLLKTAKEGDALTSKQLIEGLGARYLKIDHGVPTAKTMKLKVENGLKRKRGLGAKTAGRILTNGLVQHEGKFFIDESKLDAKRVEDGKKRGRLSKHRRLDPNYPRVLDEKPDSKRYKPVTTEQMKEIGQQQKRASVTRVLNKAKKMLKKKQVVASVVVPAA